MMTNLQEMEMRKLNQKQPKIKEILMNLKKDTNLDAQLAGHFIFFSRWSMKMQSEFFKGEDYDVFELHD